MKNLKSMREPVLYLVIASAFSTLCGTRFPVPAAHLIFLVFALRFTLRCKSITGWISILLLSSGGVILANYGALPPEDSIIMSTLPWFLTMLITFAVLLLNKLLQKGHNGFTGTLILPCIYTVIMYLYTIFNPFGTWDQMAYKFAGRTNLLQIVSITGIWGIGFLAAWTAAVVNWAWDHVNMLLKERAEGESHTVTSKIARKLGKGLIVFLTVILMVIIYGQIKVNYRNIQPETVLAAGVSVDSKKVEGVWNQFRGWGEMLDAVSSGKIDTKSLKPQLTAITDDMFDKTVTAAKGGAKIVFWAEASGYVLADDEPELIIKGEQISREYGIYLGLSLYTLHNRIETQVNGKCLNSHIVFISPQGEVLADSMKKIPLAGPEWEYLMTSESRLPLVDTQYGKVSFAVCFDNDFPKLIAQAGKASLFFLSSWEWYGVNNIHADMSSFRAIENGFSLVKVTGQGESAVYDRYGRTIASDDDFSHPAGAIMYCDVPIDPDTTVYETFGDYFPVLAFIAAIILTTGKLVRTRLRSRKLKAGRR